VVHCAGEGVEAERIGSRLGRVGGKTSLFGPRVPVFGVPLVLSGDVNGQRRGNNYQGEHDRAAGAFHDGSLSPSELAALAASMISSKLRATPVEPEVHVGNVSQLVDTASDALASTNGPSVGRRVRELGYRVRKLAYC